MNYPTSDHKSVYCSPSCRRIFSQPNNAILRKQKAIKAVVDRHNLSVSNFSSAKLVQILQYLLKEGVFRLTSEACRLFPALSYSPLPPTEPTLHTPSRLSPTPQTWAMDQLLASLQRYLTYPFALSYCPLAYHIFIATSKLANILT